MQSRNNIILQIEANRNSRVITYITSDRNPPFRAKMSLDSIRPFYEHLQKMGCGPQIDLFIYSTGGDTVVPWRLVNLIREFCDKFCVLIPYRALSAATLLSLGADEILMGPMAELSPIDPSIGTQFNPPHHDKPNERKQEISVEDVHGFLYLAKERLGITKQVHLVKVFEKLSDYLHPLSIGGVYRSHLLIRLLAFNLLSLHMKKKTDLKKIFRIVDNLAEKLYYHSYLISRDEAKKIGLKVTKASEIGQNLIWDLYLSYEKEMELNKPFDPNIYDEGKTVKAPIAFIESLGVCSKFSKNIIIKRIPAPGHPGGPPGPQITVQEQVSGWETTILKED